MKQIIAIVVIVAGIIGAAVIFGGSDEETAGAVSNNFYGKEDAAVVITEYADFECPACAQFAPVLSQVKETYKDQVRFEFKHFPLVQIHPNSIAAHRAAQAAAKQDKFWEMHDILYERQTLWRTQSNNSSGVASNAAPTFEQFAQELGLDLEKFKEDVRANETIATINADIAEGRSIGTDSTPTFYLNGVLFEDLSQLSTVDGFSAVLDDALGQVSQSSEENAEESSNEASDPTASPETEEAVRPEDPESTSN